MNEKKKEKAILFEPAWNNLLLKLVEDKPEGKIIIPDEIKTEKKEKYCSLFIVKMGPGVGKLNGSTNKFKVGAEVWIKPHTQLTGYKDEKDLYMCSEHDILGQL